MSTGLFVGLETQRRYEMKFVLIVLALHFAGEMIGGKKKQPEEQREETVLHPAEYNLR
jgi:hypothetical protein